MSFYVTIQKHVKCKTCGASDWVTMYKWPNCRKVRGIICDMIATDFSQAYPLTPENIQAMIKRLTDELREYDFRSIENITFDNYKSIVALRDLSALLQDYLCDVRNGVESEYRLTDMF